MSGETKDNIFDCVDKNKVVAFRNMLEKDSANVNAKQNGQSILEYVIANSMNILAFCIILISYGADILTNNDATYQSAITNGMIFRNANLEFKNTGTLKTEMMSSLIKYFYLTPLHDHTINNIDKKKIVGLLCISYNLQNYMVDNNTPLILHIVGQRGMALQLASPEIKGDKEVVMAAVEKDGLALFLASDDLKNDKDVVLEAVGQSWKALQYASVELKNDKEVVLAAVGQSWKALQYASVELKNDKEVVMAAVNQNGLALEFASDEMKGNKDVVMAAVGQFGLALQYASVKLKNDKEVVMTAVNNNGLALQCASVKLKKDIEVVMAAVRSRGSALFYAYDTMKNNPLVLFTAIIHSETNFHDVLELSILDVTAFKVTEQIKSEIKKKYGEDFVESINIGDSVYGVLIKICNEGFDHFEYDEFNLDYSYDSNLDALRHYAWDNISELDETSKSSKINELEQLDTGFSVFLQQQGEAQTPANKYNIKLRF